MPEFEVPEPIICSPYDEPAFHWHLQPGADPEKRSERRAAHYFYRAPGEVGDEHDYAGIAVELPLVNLIRERLRQWRHDGYPGVTRTTLELLEYWNRDGRQHRLFFAQREAVDTIVFLSEARRDYLQGVDVPVDEPSDRQKDEN